MSPSQKKKDEADGLSRVLNVGRRLFVGQPVTKAGPERRSGKRVELPVPVRVKIGDGSLRPARVHEVNQRGLSLEPAEGARVGELATVEFDGYPGVSPAFVIRARVVRILGEGSNALAVEVDRKATAPEARDHYRALVLHYLHHKPLLDDLDKGYFEGRCTSCGWVGRVGKRNPRCSQCGSKVVPIS